MYSSPARTYLPNTISYAGNLQKQPEVAKTSNSLRKMEPFLLVIGKIRVSPDVSINGSVRYLDEEQFLSQAFCFGLQKNLVLSDFKIGQRPLTTTKIISAPLQPQPTIGPDSTIVSQDITASEVKAFVHAPDDAVWLIEANISTGRFDRIDLQDVHVIPGGKLDARGTTSIDLEGPVDVVSVGIDVVGLSYSKDTQLQASHLNTAIRFSVQGQFEGLSKWEDLGEFSLTTLGLKPKRQSFQLNVKQGQWNIRVTLLSTIQDMQDSTHVHNMNVTSVRFTQKDDSDYTDQRRIGIKIKAGEAWQGRLEEFTAIATEHISAWENNAWVVKETSNPAWWFLRFLRGERNTDGVLLFGCGLTDASIDIESIKRWGAYCDEQTFTCDMVLDSTYTQSQVLSLISRCGRASPTWRTGKIGVVWHSVAQTPVALIGPSNIVRDSMEVFYDSSVPLGSVVVNFRNKARDYQLDSVRATNEISKTHGETLSIDFKGCVDEDLAGRAANLLLGNAIYNRKRIAFGMDIDGLNIQADDVIRITHPLTNSSYSGYLKEDPSGTTITLDREVRNPAASSAALVVIDGASGGRMERVVKARPTRTTLTVESAFPDGVKKGDLWYYDEATSPGGNFRVLTVEPDSDLRVKITAVIFDRAYYDSEFDRFISIPAWKISPTVGATLAPSAPIDVSVEETVIYDRNNVRISYAKIVWSQVPEAKQYMLSILDENLVLLQELTTTEIEWTGPLVKGTYFVKVRAISRQEDYSATTTVQFQIVDKAPLGDILTQLEVSVKGNGLLIQWSQSTSPEYSQTEVRLTPIGTPPENGTLITSKKSSTHLMSWLERGDYELHARHVNNGGASPYWKTIPLNITPPASPSIQRAETQFNILNMSWESAQTLQPISAYIIKTGDTVGNLEFRSKLGGDSQNGQVIFMQPGTYIVSIHAVDAAGNEGMPSYTSINIKMPDNFSVVVQAKADSANTNSTNAVWSGPYLWLPISSSKEWQDVFRDNSWTTIQEKIKAGFDMYALPGEVSGHYSFAVKLDTVVDSAIVNCRIDNEVLSGDPYIEATLYSSMLASGTRVRHKAIKNVSATNFNYLYLLVTVRGKQTKEKLDLVRFRNIEITVSLETISEWKKAYVNASDPDGTLITLNKTFARLEMATATPLNSLTMTSVSANINNKADPPELKILAYDARGNRVSGDVSVFVAGW